MQQRMDEDSRAVRFGTSWAAKEENVDACAGIFLGRAPNVYNSFIRLLQN